MTICVSALSVCATISFNVFLSIGFCAIFLSLTTVSLNMISYSGVCVFSTISGVGVADLCRSLIIVGVGVKSSPPSCSKGFVLNLTDLFAVFLCLEYSFISCSSRVEKFCVFFFRFWSRTVLFIDLGYKFCVTITSSESEVDALLLDELSLPKIPLSMRSLMVISFCLSVLVFFLGFFFCVFIFLTFNSSGNLLLAISHSL